MAAVIEVDESALRKLVAAIETQGHPRRVRLRLASKLRTAAVPGAEAARQSILAMHSGGLPHEGESLRAAVAAQITVNAKLTGDEPGVVIRTKRGGPRQFRAAARRLHQPQGWRHPVYGARTWVHQVGKPLWFDRPIRARADDYRRAVLDAMQETAAAIAGGVT